MSAIGILGGMGPRATVQFESMLLDSFTGGDQDMPTIISVNDGSIPDRSNYLLGRGTDPVPAMSRNIQFLESANASIVCIPCNTACSDEILSRIVTLPTTSLIDLPLSVIDVLHERGLKKVILLATEGTVQSNKYQKLCTTKGIECLVPSAVVQQKINAIILAVKNNEPVVKDVASELKKTIEEQSVDAVILGCTELPLIKKDITPEGVEAVDTLEVLVNKTKELLHKQRKIIKL